MANSNSIHFEISERRILLRIFDIAFVLLTLYLVGNVFEFDYFSITKQNWSWTLVLILYITIFGTIFELYDLQILERNIEDEPGNTTRFIVIGNQEVPSSGKDKTSLMLASKNEAGGLHALLTPLAKHKISMTRIESRPSRRGIWDYVFFIDVLGHKDDEGVRKAFDELSQTASFFKILGSYPIAVL